MEEGTSKGLMSTQPIALLTNHVKELRRLWQGEAKKNRQLSTAIGKAAASLRQVLASQKETSGAYLSALEVLKLVDSEESFDELPHAVVQYFDVFGAALQCMKLRSVREAFRRVVAKPVKRLNIEMLERLVLKAKAFAFGKVRVWASCSWEFEAVQAEFAAKQACGLITAKMLGARLRYLHRAWRALISTRLKSQVDYNDHIKQLTGVLKPFFTRTLALAFKTLHFCAPIHSKSLSKTLTKAAPILFPTPNSGNRLAQKTEKLGSLLSRRHESEKIFIKDSIASHPYATVNPRVINRNLINEFSITQLFRAVRAARHRTQIEAFGRMKVWEFCREDEGYSLKDAACLLFSACLSSAVSRHKRLGLEALKHAWFIRSSVYVAAALLIRRLLNGALKRRLGNVVETFARDCSNVKVLSQEWTWSNAAVPRLNYGQSSLEDALQQIADMSQRYSSRLAHIALHRFKAVTRQPSSPGYPKRSHRSTASYSPVDENIYRLALPPSVMSRRSSNLSSGSYRESTSRVLSMPNSIHDYIDDIQMMGSLLEDTHVIYSGDLDDSQDQDLQAYARASTTFINEVTTTKPSTANQSSMWLNLRGVSKFSGLKYRPNELVSHPTTAREFAEVHSKRSVCRRL